MEVKIPVSVGELVDKITILELKAARLNGERKRRNVEHELGELRSVYAALGGTQAIERAWTELRNINLALWEVEDALRECEARQDFGETFVKLARSVYRHNDARSAVKAKINDACHSAIREEKSYASSDGELTAQT